MNSKTINNRGFSIIEVMVAMLVFMIGAVGISALVNASVKNAAFSGDLTEAALLASSKLEELRFKDYDHADLADTTGDGTAGLDDLGANADKMNTSQGKSDRFTVQWNVAVNSPAADSKTIRVIVTWTYHDNTRSITLNDIRAQ